MAWSLLYLMHFSVNNYDIYEHDTRISYILHVPPSRSNLSKWSIQYQGVIIWNEMLKADKNSDASKLSFKIMLKGAIQQDVITKQSQEMNKNIFSFCLARNPPYFCSIWIMYLIMEAISSLGSLAPICRYIFYDLLLIYRNVLLPCLWWCPSYIVYIVVNKSIIHPTQIDIHMFEAIYLTGQWPHPCQLGLI